MLTEYTSLTDLSLPGSCVTIGAFDGVHMGHQSLLHPLISYGLEHALPVVMVTFDPIPAVFFQRGDNQGSIILPSERAEILQNSGVDYLITLPFNSEFAGQSAFDFLLQLKAALNFESLWVGTDFSLGNQRTGTIDVLHEISNELEFQLHVISKLEMDGDDVSSTRIRRLLSEGYLSEANRLLGYPYFFRNTVIHGEARGRKLGFPTINMVFPDGKLILAYGVYAARVHAQGGVFPAVTSVGVRPTFHENGTVVVESYILDHQLDLYETEAKVEFVEFLRPEVKFDSAAELIGQIKLDVEEARAFFTSSLI